MKTLNPASLESLSRSLVANGCNPLDAEQIECLTDYAREEEALGMLDDLEARCGAFVDDVRADVLAPRVFDERKPGNPDAYPLPSVALLASVFANIIRCELTEAQLVDVVVKNAAKTSRACHSHDYCDANMCMHSAQCLLGLEERNGPDVDALINAAWDSAKAHGFNSLLIIQETRAFTLPRVPAEAVPAFPRDRALLRDVIAAAREAFGPSISGLTCVTADAAILQETGNPTVYAVRVTHAEAVRLGWME